MRTRILGVFFAGAVFGCSGDGADVSGSIDADRLPILALAEDFRIGNASDPDLGFAMVGGMAVDDGDTLFVYESRDRRIRVYGPSGQLVRTIGAPGGGPGEFTAVTRMGLVGDTVWAVEVGTGRIILFHRSGNHLLTSVASSSPMLRPRALQSNGLFSSELLSRDLAEVPRVLFSPNGNVVDTVGIEPTSPPRSDAPPWQPSSPQNVLVNGVTYQVPRPPRGAPLWVSFDDGAAVVDRPRANSAYGAEFTVTRFTATADTAFHLRFQYRPGRYEGALLDTIAMRPVARTTGDPAAFQAVRAALDYPEFQAPIYTAFAAQDGSLWMRREDDAGPVFRWIVIDPTGIVRGIVPLPRLATPVWARSDTLWTAEPDDLGIPWLVRYRIG